MNDKRTKETEGFIAKEHLGMPWAAHWILFEREMTALGLHVHECEGPNGWGGPAVTISPERVRDIVRRTTVILDSHDVDGSVMLYPATVIV